MGAVEISDDFEREMLAGVKLDELEIMAASVVKKPDEDMGIMAGVQVDEDFRKFIAHPKKMTTENENGKNNKRSRPSKSVLVQPVKPPPERPGRVTNQLHFIRHTVLNAMSKHECVGPFREAVDPEKHYIPNYYQFITYPMDIGTIRKRLSNKFYWSAEECLKDFQYMFMNCYFYNEPDTDLVHQAQNLENLLIATLVRMPDPEMEVEENEEPRSVSAMSGFEMTSLNIADIGNADSFVDDASISTLGSQRTRRSVRNLVLTRPRVGHPRVISSSIRSLSPSSMSSNSSIISVADPENSSDIATKPKWKKFKKSLVPLLQRQMDALQEQMKLLLEEDDTIENHTTKAKSKARKKGKKRKEATLSPPSTPKPKRRKVQKCVTPIKVSSSRAKKVLSAPSNDADNNNVKILTNGVPKPLSAEELLNLEEAITTIPPEELEDVYALINSYQNGLVEGGEVDLRTLDPRCVREIQRMIADIKAPVVFRKSRSPTPVPNLIAAPTPRLPSPTLKVSASIVHPKSDNSVGHIDEDEDPRLYEY